MKKDSKTGYGLVANDVVKDAELGRLDRLLYCLICCYTGSNSGAFPSQKVLAEALGVSQRAVIKSLRNLSEKGIIEVQRNSGKGASRNVYLLFDGVPRG